VSIQPLERLEDAERIRGVISAVWGEQVVPREIIRAFQHAGSILFGAESPQGQLVGFVLGFAGLADGWHVHSHMLAAVPGWQDRGVGRALKLAQRAKCLDLGIDEVRWTFDPMVARNARFNLVKLGAEAVRLLPDFYGEMTDRLNRGDRSDRFEVRWRLSSARVERALADEAKAPALGGPFLVETDGRPHRTGEPAPGATVAIPADHHALKAADPSAARRWREETTDAFTRCFGRGLVATWFDRDGGYVFEPAEKPT